MATLQNRIELSDGVTPTLDRIVNGAAHITSNFEQVGRAAEAMSGCAETVTARFVPGLNAVGSAAHAAAGSVGIVSAAARQSAVGTNILAMTQGFDVINAVLTQICEQFVRFGQRIEIAIQDVSLLAWACNAVHAPPAAAEMREIGNAAAQAANSIAPEFYAASESIGDMNQNLGETADSIRIVNTEAGSISPPIYNAMENVTGMNHRLEETTGILGNIKEALSNTFAQFTLANVATEGVMKLVEVIIQAPGKLASMSDQYSGIMARMEMVAGSQEKATVLNDQIYYSALRARGGYAEMVDAVSKIALTAKEAFPDPKDVVPFMENVQKLFTINGTDAVRQKDALMQLTQALGSGKLQGDEFRSIAEAVPMIEPMIAQYMNKSVGELEALSSEGAITAEIMKNAILGATDEINAKLETIQMKWQDIAQNIENRGYRAFVPVFEQISRLANSPAVRQIADGIVMGMQITAMAVLGLMNNVEWLGGTIGALYSQYQPVFDGLGSTLLYVAGIWAIYKAGVIAAAIATGVWAAATAAAGTVNILVMMITDLIVQFTALGVAQTYAALSGATMWFAILLPVAAVIAVIYLVVAAINYFAGTSISATGIIFAAFAIFFAYIWNGIAFTWNLFAAFLEFFVNAFVCKQELALVSLQCLFVNIWNNIVGYVGQALDEIVGMIKEVPFLKSLVGDFSSASLKLTPPPLPDGYWKAPEMRTLNYKNEAEWAYSIKLGDIFKLPEMPGKSKAGSGGDKVPPLEDIAGSGKDTADNMESMKDAMEITDEDIKYMRDIAEQEVINKYTTAEIKIDMGGVQQNIGNNMDLDGVMNHMVGVLQDGMSSGAEAVHK